ncbi:MAG: tetratricopeptide repeat protein [Epsilonproteobacteria bacterium]|nr:tetratricopeptide repeat protein [Campylobacterota bacterium]
MRLIARLTLLALLGSGLQALDIDVASLKKIVSDHPDDIDNRIVLASYYIEHGKYGLADKYLKQVLRIDPKNEFAKAMRDKTLNELFYDKIMRRFETPDQAVEALYRQKRLSDLIKFFRAWNKRPKHMPMSDGSLLKIADIAMREGDYTSALMALKHVKNGDNAEFYRIAAYTHYYQHDYYKAAENFSRLFHLNPRREYALYLLKSCEKGGFLGTCQADLPVIEEKYPELARDYREKMEKKREAELEKLQNAYEKNPSYAHLEPLVQALYSKDPKAALDLLATHIDQNPDDKEANILLANMLTWHANDKQTIQYINMLKTSDDPKLMLLYGNLLAWSLDFDKAKTALHKVLEKGSPEQKDRAIKSLGFIAMWEDKKSLAKEYFTDYLKRHPDDEEVQEAVDVLNGHVRPYIEKYEAYVNSGNDKGAYLLKLAEYYFIDKKYKKSADYYARYLEKNPSHFEALKPYAISLIEAGEVKKGLAALEKFARLKNTKEAYFTLAQEYYWQGQYAKAKKIAARLLEENPDYSDAKELLAKIRQRIEKDRALAKRYAATHPTRKASAQGAPSTPANYYVDPYQKRANDLLKIADRAYFATFYPSAVKYYREYLDLRPKDYDARERYAYALEYSGYYPEAAGEFYLVSWKKRTPLIEYHYAQNLEKSGQKAKALYVYQNLLQKVPHPLPLALKRYLIRWKRAWESLDFRRYSRFYGPNFFADPQWKKRKRRLFYNAGYISVGIYNPVVLKQTYNTYTVKFYETYERDGRRQEGYKTLTIRCNRYGDCRIIKETFKPGPYQPHDPDFELYPLIREKIDLLSKETRAVATPKPRPIERFETSAYHPTQRYEEKNYAQNSYDSRDYRPNTYTYPKSGASRMPASSYTAQTRAPGEENVKYRQPAYPAAPRRPDLPRRPLTKESHEWQLEDHLNYFGDNNNLDTFTNEMTLQRDLSDDYAGYLLLRNYHVSEDAGSTRGFNAGVGIKHDNFLLDVFLDSSEWEDTVGWDFAYTPFLSDGLTFRFSRNNLVYTRMTGCSSNYHAIKTEITGYRYFTDYQESWWSLAYEHIDDDNNVFIPQFQYDFTTYDDDKLHYVPYAAGWYQFNSKTSDCYYSPHQADATFVGLKTFANVDDHLTAKLQVAGGYSFFDDVWLYDIGAWLYTDYLKDMRGSFGCAFKNSSTYSAYYDGYKSYECNLNFRKLW